MVRNALHHDDVLSKDRNVSLLVVIAVNHRVAAAPDVVLPQFPLLLLLLRIGSQRRICGDRRVKRRRIRDLVAFLVQQNGAVAVGNVHRDRQSGVIHQAKLVVKVAVLDVFALSTGVFGDRKRLIRGENQVELVEFLLVFAENREKRVCEVDVQRLHGADYDLRSAARHAVDHLEHSGEGERLDARLPLTELLLVVVRDQLERGGRAHMHRHDLRAHQTIAHFDESDGDQRAVPIRHEHYANAR